MQNRRVRSFELRLGKTGVILFTLGVSCLLLVSFVLGVMVGKNIETYPEKITDAIPGLIRDKIARTPVTPGVVAAPEETAGTGKTGKEEQKLTFFDTLGGKKGDVREDAPPPAVKEEKPPAKEVREAVAAPEEFVIQVASLRNEAKARQLYKSLKDMGYQPTLDTRDLKEGKFYRVLLGGYKTRDEAAAAADILEKKTKTKCMVAPAR